MVFNSLYHKLTAFITLKNVNCCRQNYNYYLGNLKYLAIQHLVSFIMKYRKLILGITIILIFLVITPLIVAHIYKDQIKQELEEEIDEKIHATVTFDELYYSFFIGFPKLTLAMNNVTICGLGTFEGDTLAHIDRIDFKLNWIKLIFRNKISVDQIDLVKPILNLLVLQDGTTNYRILNADTSTNNKPFPVISLNKFKIKQGTIRLLDKATNRFFVLEGIDHVGNISMNGNLFDYITDTQIQHVTINDNGVSYLQDKKITLNSNIQYNLDSHLFLINESAILINDVLFELRGKITYSPHSQDMDVVFSSKETTFKEILSLVPNTFKEHILELKTDGLIACTGSINGIYSDTSIVLPKFKVDFAIENAMVQVPNFPSKIKNIQCDLRIENAYGNMDSTVFNLKTFNLEIDEHPIKGRFLMKGLSEPYIDMDIQAELKLEHIENVFPIKHVDVSGDFNFNVTAKGRYKHVESKIIQIPIFDLNLSVNDGILKYDSSLASFHGIQFLLKGTNEDGDPNHTAINLSALKMFLGENTLSGSLLMKGMNPSYIKSDLGVTMNLEDIEKLYPKNNNIIKGLFKSSILIDGLYDSKKHLFPTIHANIDLNNGYLKSPNFSEPIKNIALHAQAINTTGKTENTRLNIEKLNFLMEDNPFTISGTIEDFIKLNYDFKIKGALDLEKLTTVFPINGSILSGLVQTDIESTGSISNIEKSDFSNIYCSGTVDLENIKYKSTLTKIPIHINTANLQLLPQKIVLTNCDGRLGKTNFALTGDITNYMYFLTANNDMITGDLILKSDTLDLTPWIDHTFHGKTNNSQAMDSLPAMNSNSQIFEIPKNVHFVFDSDIKNVYYQDLHVANLLGEITIHDGVLALTETGFNSLNANFAIDGHYNTFDVTNPFFDVQINVSELDINKAYTEIALIRKLAPAAADTYGKVSINYKLKGGLNQNGSINLSSLDGGGNVTIANAKIHGMKMFDEISRTAKKELVKNPELKNVSLDSEIHNNKLIVKPFSLKLNGLNTDIEGSNDITGGNLNYLVQIELIPIDKIKVPFHISGTYSNPKVTMGKGKKEN
jgi:AsmA protein